MTGSRTGREMLYAFGILHTMTEARGHRERQRGDLNGRMRLLRRGFYPELVEGLLAMTEGGATLPGSLYGISYSYREP